jgi:hypothetical protein
VIWTKGISLEEIAAIIHVLEVTPLWFYLHHFIVKLLGHRSYFLPNFHRDPLPLWPISAIVQINMVVLIFHQTAAKCEFLDFPFCLYADRPYHVEISKSSISCRSRRQHQLYQVAITVGLLDILPPLCHLIVNLAWPPALPTLSSRSSSTRRRYSRHLPRRQRCL